jgi:hypothetical protein
MMLKSGWLGCNGMDTLCELSPCGRGCCQRSPSLGRTAELASLTTRASVPAVRRSWWRAGSRLISRRTSRSVHVLPAKLQVPAAHGRALQDARDHLECELRSRELLKASHRARTSMGQFVAVAVGSGVAATSHASGCAAFMSLARRTLGRGTRKAQGSGRRMRGVRRARRAWQDVCAQLVRYGYNYTRTHVITPLTRRKTKTHTTA